MPDRPVLLCYDASEDARHAISIAAQLFGARPALVLTVWQDIATIPPFAWVAPMGDVGPLLDEANVAAHRVADEGAELARSVGFTASPLAVEAAGPVWEAIAEAAEEHDAEAIVLGTRGLSGVRSALAGSVSTRVVHHARRPALVVPRRRA
jgi:nucleotide-binding universal stress UspA family protein